MRFKIAWASLMVGSKFTIFALFYFVFEGNFLSTSSRELFLEGVFLRRRFEGWGFICRGLLSVFYGMRLNFIVFTLPVFFQSKKKKADILELLP